MTQTANDRNRLCEFLTWLDLFSDEVNKDVASQQIALFLHVALKPGQTMLELFTQTRDAAPTLANRTRFANRPGGTLTLPPSATQRA